jgi:hypothetical protein
LIIATVITAGEVNKKIEDLYIVKEDHFRLNIKKKKVKDRAMKLIGR